MIQAHSLPDALDTVSMKSLDHSDTDNAEGQVRNRATRTRRQGLPMRLLRLFAATLWFAGGYVAFLLRKYVSGKRPLHCVILYYHGVAPDERQRFGQQLDAILRFARPVAVTGQLPHEARNRYVAVTFDDGLDTVATQALPELLERRIPAAVFVMSDLLGQDCTWKDYQGHFLSSEELLRLPHDLITFGSHTCTHAFLPGLDREGACWEIHESRAKLEKLLGRRITHFSFPYGAFNEGLIEICREAGYEHVFTTVHQPARRGINEFVLGRVRVDPHDWPIEFRLKLHGAYNWLPIAIALKRKVVRILRMSGMGGALVP